MRLTAVFTVIGAFTALSSAASSNNGNGEHLALLTRKQRSVDNNVHGDPMRSKRQHGNPALNGGLKKKTKRASGYCKAKTTSGSSSSSSKANAVVTPSSSSKANNTPASSSSSSRQQQASSSSPAAAPAATSSSSDSSSGSGTANAQLGSISAFQGTNSGIMSWFKTNLGSDSTNGESWCQTKYQDDWLCFAPSVGTMLNNFGGDYSAATKAYCGREVKVTYKGKSTLAFICDGFDDKWVLSPGSIDATVGLFTEVYGSFDNNKNTVGQGVEWEFTGGVVEKGTFQNGKY